MSTDNQNTSPFPDGLSVEEFRNWHTTDSRNAEDYARAVGVDPVRLGCLPGGVTVEDYEALKESNPIAAHRYATDNQLAERGYRSPNPSIGDHRARLAALRPPRSEGAGTSLDWTRPTPNAEAANYDAFLGTLAAKAQKRNQKVNSR